MKGIGILFSIIITVLVVIAVVLCIVLIIYSAAPTQFTNTYNEKIFDSLKIAPYTTEVKQLFPSDEIENKWSLWKSMADSAKQFSQEKKSPLSPIEKLQKFTRFGKNTNLSSHENIRHTILKSHGTVKLQGKIEEGISLDWLHLPEILYVSYMYVEKGAFEAPNIPGAISYILPLKEGEIHPKCTGERCYKQIEYAKEKGFIARPGTTFITEEDNQFLVVAFIPKKITGFVSKFNSGFSKLLDKVHNQKEVKSISKKFWK